MSRIHKLSYPRVAAVVTLQALQNSIRAASGDEFIYEDVQKHADDRQNEHIENLKNGGDALYGVTLDELVDIPEEDQPRGVGKLGYVMKDFSKKDLAQLRGKDLVDEDVENSGLASTAATTSPTTEEEWDEDAMIKTTRDKVLKARNERENAQMKVEADRFLAERGRGGKAADVPLSPAVQSLLDKSKGGRADAGANRYKFVMKNYGGAYEKSTGGSKDGRGPFTNADVLVYDNVANVVRAAKEGNELRLRTWNRRDTGGDKIIRDVFGVEAEIGARKGPPGKAKAQEEAAAVATDDAAAAEEPKKEEEEEAK